MTDDQLAPLARPRPLDPYSSSAPHLVAIVDTNVLLTSIDNDCRNVSQGRRSRLLLMSDGGDVVLYAADHVLDEMYEHLPRIAKSSPVPLATLRAYFEAECLPVLRFVTVSEVDAPDPQVLAITDPDDVPTGRLAKLIAPCVVFSDDIHLKRPGFAPKRWLDMAKAAVEVADGHRAQVATVNAAAIPVRGVAGLLSFAGRKVNVSPWVLGGVALSAAALLLKQPEWRKATAEVTSKIFEGIANQLAEGMALERGGAEKLRKVVLGAPLQPTLRQRIAIVLARQNEPLLAAEVHDLIDARFPEAPDVSIKKVRGALEEGTEFVRVQRYRWQLGREVAPRVL
ncbi:hypothetical protein QNN03_37490 [Streptomyces sp. GXMU-J15]|uniref:PIN domain-containing protein n=1 Tax=Streptomyces fuscus TaxID=3048495 RepID=A0ABT7JB85_9ACTN|nr:hypothetical protein [Streptomyces fuscus]MDL2082129.1 hypothetical protein [Streptomyces fuscus]